jgi:hypothetical protein
MFLGALGTIPAALWLIGSPVRKLDGLSRGANS